MSNKYRKRIAVGLSSFLRDRGQKEPAKGILIATEGEVTEPVYFEALKKKLSLPTVELHVAGKGIGDPKTLAQAALQEQAKRRKALREGSLGFGQVAQFDEIWIVFDTDVPAAHGKLVSGIKFAKDNGISCAHSTPCFEYWLLLHFESERTTAPMPKCANVIPRLGRAMGARYAKNSKKAEALILPLVENLPIAEAAAVWVRNYHTAAGTPFPQNPSSQVDLLITAIRAAASPANENR